MGVVLVVEDVFVVALEVRRIVTAAGHEVLGPVKNLDGAYDLLATKPPDLAVLDVDFDGEKVYALADHLLERRVPVVFISGFERRALPPRLQRLPIVDKPFAADALRNAIEAALDAGQS